MILKVYLENYISFCFTKFTEYFSLFVGGYQALNGKRAGNEETLLAYIETE